MVDVLVSGMELQLLTDRNCPLLSAATKQQSSNGTATAEQRKGSKAQIK